ncbi:FMN-dependent NADH-azoreductase [Roseibium sp. SCP14]|uniref:FMN-dependent NADH-azoreductase n=1 Tax=Roseibium sp. SCP14 TaxID=3141375 RepID=UPI003334BF31
MLTLLQINTGIHGPASMSSILADEIAEAFSNRFSGTNHIKRDLGEDPIPHLDQATFESFSNPVSANVSAFPDELALSDKLISELKQADVLLIGAPMYNFMIPSTLKAWIDNVARAGETFRFSETGPVGLLSGKRAILVIAQGGEFLGTPADLQTGYLRMALGLMGITEIEFVYAMGLAMGPDKAEAGLEVARKKIAELFGPVPV